MARLTTLVLISVLCSTTKAVLRPNQPLQDDSGVTQLANSPGHGQLQNNSVESDSTEGLLSDCTDHSHTSCLDCVTTPQLTDFGKVVNHTPCRWCPATQECHAYGSLFDGACDIPIHTNDVENKAYANYVCKAAEYPHIASDFSNTDIDALEQVRERELLRISPE